ncbi:MAG: ABC transporter permease [Firmicutes bacterium]|nr:ABC transporter permease [Bacillota bacterium]
MFWSMAFPLILGTFFHLAFSGLASNEVFRRIPVAVVESPEFEADAIFRQVLETVSAEDRPDALLKVTYADREEAERRLAAGEVDGIIDYAPGLGMTVLQSGINQTILKGFLDDFLQTVKTAETVIAKDPLKALDVMADLNRRETYLRDAPVNPNVKNPYVTYFYTLIAMACLYGGFLGLRVVTHISADMSPHGMRVSVTPTHKMKLFVSCMAAAVAVQLVEITVLMIYLTGILGVDFGGQILSIAAACAAGSLCGAAFGAMIGCVVRGGEWAKTGVLVGSTMLLCYMAGMMSMHVRYEIARGAPAAALLNPANLLCDAFYSLYFGLGQARYGRNILLLLALTAAFSLIAYGKLRRQKYASL